MHTIPVIGFAGYSGSGKTTIIEALVRELKRRGLRLAVIKHDGHDFEIDHEGKDSWRFAQAGADVTLLSSQSQCAYIEKRFCSFDELLNKIHDVDLILVEGYKHEVLPQIGIARAANGKGLPFAPEHFIALVTDRKIETDIPCFALGEIGPLADFVMEKMTMDFTHFNAQGRAKMVDVGEKSVSRRSATAAARVLVSRETYRLIESGGMKKGDVLTVAQIAGIMGAKKTSELIPMCHPIMIDGIDLSLHLDEARCSVEIEATVSCDGRTGVEMEALSAVSTAALTVYDMCKAVQKDMIISDIRLLSKTGGVHGDFQREEDL